METNEIEEVRFDEDQERSPKKKATKLGCVLRVILLTGVVYGLMLGFAIVGYVLALGIPVADENALLEVFGNLGLLLAVLIICAMVRNRTGERVRDAVKLRHFNFMLVIMLTLAGWSLGEACDHFMGVVLSNFMSIEPDVNNIGNIWTVISAVFCAPILEELIFRFGFMGLLRESFGKVFTITFSTIIFAVVHTYNIQNTTNVIMGTLLVAYVYYRTGNILYTMCEHFLHNALCCIPFGEMSICGVDVYFEKNGFIMPGMPWLIINLIVLAISMAWLIRFFGRKGEQDGVTV